jgi:hypothetical protein
MSYAHNRKHNHTHKVNHKRILTFAVVVVGVLFVVFKSANLAVDLAAIIAPFVGALLDREV